MTAAPYAPAQAKLLEGMRRKLRRLNDQASILRMAGSHQLSEDYRLARQAGDRNQRA